MTESSKTLPTTQATTQTASKAATDQQVIAQTRHWVESVIVALNFCPFAKRELDRDTVYFAVLREAALEDTLHRLIDECVRLDKQREIETSLLILPQGFESFDAFLYLLELANALLAEQGYEGTYQLASFHPDYCFADTPVADAANYTNRSPWPLLHLIREASIERALIHYPQAEEIPERNMALAREKGEAGMQDLLAACQRPDVE